jgi:hypothetical protein
LFYTWFINSATTTEIAMRRTSKHKIPLALPIQFGLADGSNANLLVDAKGEVFGNLFGIMQGVSIEEARRSHRSSRGVKTADFLTHAVNTHDGLVLALKKISATAQHKRIAVIATDALTVAGEM